MSDFPSAVGPHSEPPVPAVPLPPAPLLQPLALPPLPPRVSASKNFAGTLAAGLRLALLGKPSVEGLRLGPGLFWALMATSLLLAAALAWLAVDSPRRFDLWGLESEAFFFLPLLLAGTILARLWSRPELLWRFATLTAAASLYSNTVSSLVYQHLLPQQGHDEDPYYYWGCYAVLQCWKLAVTWRTLSLLDARGSGARHGLAALGFTALLAALFYYMPYTGIWEKDYSAEFERKRVLPLVAEEVFSHQGDLLDRALADIAPTQAGKPSLYFVAYAPDSEQDVFRKEALYSAHLFRERFGAAHRSLTLVNSRSTVNELPLASSVNLDRGLRSIGRKMNPQQDILFLYLTSHGSRDATLATKLPGLSFNAFNAPRLAQILKGSGIRWKVIVVSACYSGSFLDSLKDDHALVMTASRADRTSFGCSDDAEFTWFGRAYLEQALNQTTSFTEAFSRARTLVEQWETRDKEVHSEPQIAEGALIGAKLEQWRATLPGTPPGISAPGTRVAK